MMGNGPFSGLFRPNFLLLFGRQAGHYRDRFDEIPEPCGTNPTTMGKLDANGTDQEAASSGACHHEGGLVTLGARGP
jgi:hypothetical protein